MIFSIMSNNVLQKLSALSGATSVGFVGIPGDFIYQLRDMIFYPLWILFRWLHDTGTNTKVQNYRLIFVLPHLSNMFEPHILNKIMPSLNSILFDEQHGFRCGRSTVTCIVIFCNYIYDVYKNGSQVDVIY